MGNSRGAAPGNFVAIPYSADPATAFNAAFTQLAQKARKQPPAIDIAKVQDIAMQGGTNEFMFGDIDFIDGQGKQYLVAQMINTPAIAEGTWQMTLYVMYGPQQVMGQEGEHHCGDLPQLQPQYADGERDRRISKFNRVSRMTNQSLNTVAQYTDSSDRIPQACRTCCGIRQSSSTPKREAMQPLQTAWRVR